MAIFEIKFKGRLLSHQLDKNLVKEIETRFKAQGAKSVESIVKRTKSGKNVSGQNFPRYTEGYRKQKSRAGLPTSPVDLTFSGRMLGSLKHKTRRSGTKIESTITLSDDAGKVEGVQKRRPFFGISKDMIKSYQDILDDINLTTLNQGD